MADDAPKFVTRLLPQDEYTHTPESAANYNESMYFNVFDHQTQVGGWFRIGNRPNEYYAEMSICLYLPGGRVGFMFARPKIANNDEMNAGGLKIEVVEPFKRLRLSYDGKICLLARPFEMADPSKAFRENPHVACKVELDYEGVSPMFGGETVLADGSPRELDPEKSFARAHYEQHVAAKGRFTVGGETFEIDGYGLRDKSWGPRHWSAINWYRWCPLNFGRDFGMMLSVIAGEDGVPHEGGMVFVDGGYELISECKLDTDWDEHGYQTGLRAKVKTRGGRSYDVSGKVLSLIPLRSRRKGANGEALNTRITEGMTEYRCGELVGYGLSEYLDQIVDGKPSGKGD
ncbi:MAG TPA: hypothetical protein VFE13_13225 [Caulobacteraceae bacterium]|jgi:hypothetical protein|nr:hypothetical protein [Caulobacteraceae bacterium]